MSNKADIHGDFDRRGPNRTRDDADWESKVLGRVRAHLQNLPEATDNPQTLGWEATVLDTLRRKIERESK
jgi:hypothetical protein